MKLDTSQVESKKCSICGVLLDGEGFTCPKCRRTLLCNAHRYSGRRECASCVYEEQRRELLDLTRQEAGLKGFTRLLQFVFLVFAVLFVAVRFEVPGVPEFIAESFIADSLIYLGIAAAGGYLLMLIVLYNQRKQIAEREAAMRKIEKRRS